MKMICKGASLKRMIGEKIGGFLVLALLISILPTSIVMAYSIGDYHWDSTGTTYDITSLPSDWQTQVSAAANSWNGSGANFTFTSSSSSGNDLTQEYRPDDSCIGLSGGYYIYGTNHWASCWTIFNTRYTFSTDGSSGTYDIQSVAVHELGHWLKLNDVYFWPWESKVMYFVLNTGTLRRTLQQDDINGINAIYP